MSVRGALSPPSTGVLSETRRRSANRRSSSNRDSGRGGSQPLRASRLGRHAPHTDRQSSRQNQAVVSLVVPADDEDDLHNHDTEERRRSDTRPSLRRRSTGPLTARTPSPAGSDTQAPAPAEQSRGYSPSTRSSLRRGSSSARGHTNPRDFHVSFARRSVDDSARSASARRSLQKKERLVKDATTAATAHFRRATMLGKRLDNQNERWDSLKADNNLHAEMAQNFQSVAHLTEELDGLFAEMGRQTAVLRAGQPRQLRLIGGVTRTVEVRLPRAREDGEETTVQVECRCDPHHHSADEDGRRQGLLAEENFDMFIAETQRQVPDGPFRAQSTQKPAHRLRFTTDNIVLWVCFHAKKECHLNFICRSLQGGQQSTYQKVDQSANRESLNDDDEDQPMQLTSSVGQKLQAKLKVRKQDLLAEQANEETLRKIRKDSEEMAAALGGNTGSSAPSTFLYRMQHFAEWLFDGQKPPRDEQQILDAKKRIMLLIFGPCNKYTKKGRRAKGTWVKSLSAECPRKLIRFLRKAEQDRQALTMLAAVGGFSFFMRRQRELHLMRARAALRQLVWYKVLFAASRLRYMMVFCARSREEALQKARERMAHSYARQHTKGHEESDSDSDSERPVEEVRKYVNLFAKMHPGPGTAQRLTSSSGQSTGQLKPQATAPHTESSSSLPQEGSSSERANRRNPANSLDLLGPRPGSGSQGVDKFRHRRALVSEDQLLEWRLASQGFFVHPQPGASGHGHGPGARGEKGNLSSRSQQQDILKDLSESLGRQVLSNTPPPLGITEDPHTPPDDDHDRKHNKAMHEVSSGMLLVTVRPEEIAKLREASPPSRIEQIGSNNFKRFYQESASRAAQALVRRRDQQAKVERGGNMPMKIAKRYLLQFFEEEQAELTWLPIMQSLMLVIQNKIPFQTPHENFIFETKLRSFKEARKAAMRGPGLFRPVEAALWSHPKILERAGRLQRAMCRGDGALAWKSALFEGCYMDASDRDVVGATLNTRSYQGDQNSKILRKLADVSGQFATDTCEYLVPPPLAAELTPHQPQCLATKAASGYPVRSLGESNHGAMRPDESHLDIPYDIVPRDLRIENIRRRRRAKAALDGPREGHELVADSDLQAQQRFGEWMMRTDVPAKAQRFKAQMQPFFEGLVAYDSPTFSKPLAAAACAQAVAAQRAAAQSAYRAKRAARKTPRTESTVSEKSDADTDMPGSDEDVTDTAGEDIATSRQSSKSSHKAPALSADGTKIPEPRAPEKPKGDRRVAGTAHVGVRGKVLAAGRHSPSSNGSDATSQSKKESVDDQEESAPLASARKPLAGRGAPVGPPAPQTAEEVGRLFMQSDALQTILSLDASEIGGFAHRCPAGWNSGYRVEPMSKDEIRKARIVEKFSSSKLNF
mmetsp:Transcript_82097/g.150108  ORF Transcript_82097/g.150108 Transcript_82097/m.150108 type:complete len:1390 (-) Transcript_82097:80-4249(-)